MTTVRLAGLRDVPGVYRVCLLTGAAGQDATSLHHDPDLLGHVYAGPHLAGAADHALVATDGEGILGYCLGAPDTRAFEDWAEREWWPPLREDYPLTDADDADGDLIRLLHHPQRAAADVVARYPAHLHIDLLPRARGTGLGRLLIERQVAALRGVAGLHLGVARENTNAQAFYRHLGLVVLDEDRSSVTMGLTLA